MNAKRVVHWENNDISLSDLHSPSFDFNGSMESIASTSSLDYINSQLVSHGYAPSPGLVLDGVSMSDQERVVKCLFGLLNQRIEDMSRTEELTTNLRTLTYEHERLQSMHRSGTERAANAEREMNIHKTRSTAASRSLQTSETAHRHTTAELQRTRTLLQGVRATHQSELKKKEKDIERMAEKWSKLAEMQAKLGAIPSGIRCANVGIVDGSEVFGKGQGFLEIALEEAENARCQLGKENMCLKKLVLSAVNEIQSVLHQARRIVSDNEDEPTPFTLTTLFPLHPQTNANDKLDLVLSGLRECLNMLPSPNAVTSSTSKPTSPASDGELERLQGIIVGLEEEMERSRKQSLKYATETQCMFDKFAKDHRIASGDIGDMSVELMTAPERDKEKERLDLIKRDLDLERKKFTEAAIKLGKERAELEGERIKLLDEKRSWQVEMMLAELPPTPQPFASPKRGGATHPSPKKSPRKSPAKIRVGKAGVSGRKTTRVSRRSLVSPSKVVPSYETEVLQPLSAPTFNDKPLPLAASLLPNSFVLPPPSPQTSLPSQPALPQNNSSNVNQPSSHVATSISPPLPISTALPSGSTLTPAAPRSFPVAKPFAQRMIHAYSPARPSPLSRILMLVDSPNSPDGLIGSNPDYALGPLAEEDEIVPGFEEMPKVAVPLLQQKISLAAKLGVESPPESPLQEKKLEPNVVRPVADTEAAKATVKGRVFHLDPKRLSAKEKGKAKPTEPGVNGNARMKALTAVEKENSTMKPNGKVFSAPGGVTKISPSGSGVGEIKKSTTVKPPTKLVTSSTSTSRPKLSTKVLPPVKGGPRRVLVDSVDAPVLGKGWRG